MTCIVHNAETKTYRQQLFQPLIMQPNGNGANVDNTAQLLTYKNLTADVVTWGL